MGSSTFPPGYVELQDGDSSILVLEECREHLDGIEIGDIVALRRRASGAPLRGRSSHFAIELGGGGRAVVKESRHGGMRGWILPDVYFGAGRFHREIQVTREAERRGIWVAPILASVTRPAGMGFCRHHFLVSQQEGARDLRQVLPSLSEMPARRRRELVRAVAVGIRSLHDAGICHADLNLGNILIRGAESTSIEVGFIDLDTSRLAGKPSFGKRIRNLLRLYRSLVKSRPLDGIVSRADLVRFTAAYTQEDRGGTRLAWRAFRRRLPVLLLHKLLWGLGIR
ncbi:MAG: phosphotransferase [Planctomycetota bacterium]|nr:phosphotransferase [Planctomycetota bacterium]